MARTSTGSVLIVVYFRIVAAGGALETVLVILKTIFLVSSDLLLAILVIRMINPFLIGMLIIVTKDRYLFIQGRL